MHLWQMNSAAEDISVALQLLLHALISQYFEHDHSFLLQRINTTSHVEETKAKQEKIFCFSC